MLAPKTKRNIIKILPFAILWLVFGSVYLFIEKGLLGDLTYYPSTKNPYDFESTFSISIILIFCSGLLVGAIEVLYLNKIFLHKTLGKKIVYKTATYILMITLLLILITIIANSFSLQTSPFDQRVFQNLWAFFSNFAFWSLEIYAAAIIGVSLFYNEVSENLGHGVLMNFFTGKYHKPIEEERIFMFLDMKSSTTHAEKLGHVKYFEMLRAYYSDLSDAIVQHSGEVYQYVGDEIVISWKLKNGLNQNNCIESFYKMKTDLEKQSEKYLANFGVLPTFKAGLHYGKVTTGEIGAIKKDIIFTGDVLNTTARVQGLCNKYEVDILISNVLKDKLDADSEYQFKSLGEAELKGRAERVALFTIVE